MPIPGRRRCYSNCEAKYRMRRVAKSIYQQVIPLSTRTRIYRARELMAPNRLLALASAMCTDPTIRQYRQRLLSLKDSYCGHRCFIMGNGPSLNQTSLNKLQNDFVWGMNRCYLLFDRISWRPAFYTAIDKRVVPDNSEEINELIRKLPKTLFFFPMDFRLQKILLSSSNTYWYKEIPNEEAELPYSWFSISASDYVRAAKTVTIAAIQAKNTGL